VVSHNLSEGWIHINGGFVSGVDCGMSLRGKWYLNEKRPDVKIEHYPGDGHFGFDLMTRERKIELRDIYFDDRGDAEACLECLDSLNSGGVWPVKLQVDKAGNHFKVVGGTGIEMQVLCTDYSKVEKVALGDTQLYKINMIKLEQAK